MFKLLDEKHILVAYGCNIFDYGFSMEPTGSLIFARPAPAPMGPFTVRFSSVPMKSIVRRFA